MTAVTSGAGPAATGAARVRGDRWRPPHAPGLDGVRGLAVVAVVAYHLDLPVAGGGFLGVEVFFTLSGFLVAGLLAAERRATGRVDVGAFARARARRLVPALLVCVAGTVVAHRLLLPAGAPSLRADALASLASVQNWQLVLGGMPYAEAFARPSPLLHVWSLSVESQLYLVWTLLFVGLLALLSRTTAVVLTLLLAWLSAALMAASYSPDDGGLAYYVTPARASGFLVGAALALLWRPGWWSRHLPRGVQPLLDAAGLAARVVVGVAFAAVSEFDAALYTHGGFLRIGLATAVLITAATRPGVTATLLATAPIAALGRRSYGLYLYHWPVFVLGRELPGPGFVRGVLCLALTLLLTEVSYRGLERPIRRGALRTAAARLALPRASVSAQLGVATALAVAVVLATGPTAPPVAAEVAADVGVDVGADAAAEVPAGEPAADAVGAGAAALAGPPPAAVEEGAAAAGPAPPATPSRQPPSPAPGTGGRAPALVVGDSIALGSAAALRGALGTDTTVDARVGRQFAASPAIVGAWSRAHDGPVVLALGANGTVLPRDLDAVLAGTGGRRVVLVGVAVPRRWRDGNNAVLRAAAGRHGSRVAFVDWAGIVAAHPGVLGPDGVHPGPRGRVLLAGAVAAAIRR